MAKSRIVIPARLASTRLPEKLLQTVAGKSILQYTYEAARRSQRADSIVVAVDDQRLYHEVERFGGQAVMTSVHCKSGTDRISEVMSQDDGDIYVNVQGDEPEIDAENIDQVIELLESHPDAAASTLATPIGSPSVASDPNCVKVVTDSTGNALYFSRSLIPFPRDREIAEVLATGSHLLHLGIYGYRRETLEWFSTQPQGRLEQMESLEQLRLLEAGKSIVVGQTHTPAVGIDTPQDLEAFERRMAMRNSRDPQR